MAPVNVAISPTQHRVLVALKRRGDATADELAAALEISTSAVRQHLSALRAAGYVASRQERGQPGRPAHRYHATELTEPLFATTADRLSTELLGYVEEEDPELVNRVFERRRRRLVDRVKDELLGEPLDKRVDTITELLDAQGYLADSEKLGNDHYRIKLHSCAIWAVASHYQQACTTELEFIRDLLPDATVERVTHKAAGAHTCAYDIRAGTASSPGSRHRHRNAAGRSPGSPDLDHHGTSPPSSDTVVPALERDVSF